MGRGGQEEVRGVCCHPPLPLFLELVLQKFGPITTDGCLAWLHITHNPITRLLSWKSPFHTTFGSAITSGPVPSSPKPPAPPDPTSMGPGEQSL